MYSSCYHNGIISPTKRSVNQTIRQAYLTSVLLLNYVVEHVDWIEYSIICKCEYNHYDKFFFCPKILFNVTKSLVGKK